jgi:NAD+ synthase (glutamine-hydrolysing)
VKLALAQINTTVGDFTGNQRKILEFAHQAAGLGADLVMFPEMAVCGYPPADLLEKPAFLARSVAVTEEIAREAPGIGILVGYVTPAPEGAGKHARNCAALLMGGRIVFSQSKRLLPYYDVFDEQRYFVAATEQNVTAIDGEPVGITICEDVWNDKDFWERPLYRVDPVDELSRQGAKLLLNISASPFWRAKPALRAEMLSAVARKHSMPVAMVNQVGGNDSLIFDGNSMVLNADGEIVAQAAAFVEELLVVDLERSKRSAMAVPEMASEDEREIRDMYEALVLGTRDYIRKCGFSQAIIGLSGGIDSALVAAIAVDAVGSENVMGVLMPSAYSSEGSLTDSRALAKNLGLKFTEIPIADVFAEFKESLGPAFAGRKPDLTEENLQSRIRGVLLMAMSNKLGALVLSTGNKSEMSVGYCTLYGDMVGALAVLGDVFKTDVYRLSRYANRDREVIPDATITKPPSAELRPGQVDTDSLPPYEILDPVLQAYVERYWTPDQIANATGTDITIVREIVALVERSEYKRQQAAPVLKVSEKSFGMGRRFPIAVKVQV